MRQTHYFANSAIDLESCPFCNSDCLGIQKGTPDREGIPTAIICEDCGAVGPWAYSLKNNLSAARTLWNDRVKGNEQETQTR